MRSANVAENGRKCPIAVVLIDVDLSYWTSKFEYIAAFTAIFNNICTAHAQKRLFVHFRCKYRHRRSIRRPRFPGRVQNFGDLGTFSVDFCILYYECPPYFYFRYKFRHRRSIRRPRFPIKVQNFGDSALFYVNFCI